LLAVIPAEEKGRYNIVTLCFLMHCSYKPPMMAVAVQKGNASYDQIKNASEYVLAVPGQSMLRETLFCGTKSGRDVDKIRALNLELCASSRVTVPGLQGAIANIEVARAICVESGDHVVAIGRVLRFAVNAGRRELPLLSIGPDTDGYVMLAHQGIHRIGTVRV
jgi:flavin reductase (DIM6/NTAB) family NADH-FMN oxidoreductase RutF